MSTAAPFRYHRSFPFCVTDISGSVSVHATYVDNLTLTQVMAFAWNLETFTLSTTGTATVGADVAYGDMSFTLQPIFSGEMENAESVDGGMWFGDAFAGMATTSWPDILQPKERICRATTAVNGCLLDLYAYNTGTLHHQLEAKFWIGTDPGNAGKFRLYYEIGYDARDLGPGTTAIFWTNESAAPGGMTSITSGTITIAGITLNWYSNKTTGASHTGGTMSASSTSFTY